MRAGTIAVVGVVLAVAAKPATAGPVNQPPRPLEVIAIASRSSPAAWTGVDRYLATIAGSSAVQGEAVMWKGLAVALGVPDGLTGLEASAPIYAIYADDGQNHGLVVVTRVRDASALASSASGLAIEPRGKWVTIGAKPLVDLVSSWAMWTLVASSPTPGVQVTIYPGALLARYQNELAGVRTSFGQVPMASAILGMFDATLAVIGEAERVQVTLDAKADRGWLDVAVIPRAGTVLATWVDEQAPSDYALASSLPTGMVVLAGRLTLGPYRDGFFTLAKQFYSALAGPDIMSATEALMAAATGEFAVSGDFIPGSPMRFSELFGLTDGKAGKAAIDSMVQAMANAHKLSVGGIETTYTLGPDTTYAGVVVHEVDSAVDTSKLAGAQKTSVESMLPGGKVVTSWATRDRVAVMTSGTDASHVIDLLAGTTPKSKLSGPTAALVDASRQRKDSIVAVVHLDRFVPGTPPGAADMVTTVGFSRHAMRLHLDLLASLFAALANKP
jgi:hypothetical protein